MARTGSFLLSLSLGAALGLALGGCSDAPPDTDQMMPMPIDDGANPDVRCQPIAQTGSRSDATCALPFPSSYYLKTDPSTHTGFRINFPAGLLPRNAHGVDFNPQRLNLLDGFSPATQIVADLGARVDPSQLAPVDGDPQPSLTAAAPVQLVRYDTGQRVPVFAEVDANVAGDSGDAQALIIRPLVRLDPGARYVVALRDLKDTAGKPIVVKPFRALAEQSYAPTSRLVAEQARYTEIFALLDRLGVPRQNLTLAWDFVTASDERIQSNLLHMRDGALTRVDADKLGFTVTKVSEPTDQPLVLRIVEGTFSVPSFLVDATDPSVGMKQDAQGVPMDTGKNYEANLLLIIPACAKTATPPLRVVVYGHGLLGAADEIESSLHRNIANKLCIIEMATDFIGLSDSDLMYLGTSVLPQFDLLSIPTDRLQQAQVNFAVLTHLARTKLKDLPALTLEGTAGGHPLVDGTQVYYLGGSQGGIFGNTIVAISPDLDRGVLNVGGGIYSMMLPRSIDFGQFQGLISASYPDPLAMQLLLALSQSYWDFSDPITFARRNLKDPLPGVDGKPMAPKQILLQESRNDCQVPNVATRTVARSMGLPQLKPAVEPVFGLTQVDAQVDSAYVQYDTQLQPAPSRTNVPDKIDNGAHGSLGEIPQVVDQMDAFLRPGGRVQNTCGTSCVFPLHK
jgi:hypothetical protein